MTTTTLIHHSDRVLAPSMGGSSNYPTGCQFVSLGIGSNTNSELLSAAIRNTVKRQPTLRDSLDLIYREYGDLMQRLAD